jgi:hypothetical protein
VNQHQRRAEAARQRKQQEWTGDAVRPALDNLSALSVASGATLLLSDSKVLHQDAEPAPAMASETPARGWA